MTQLSLAHQSPSAVSRTTIAYGHNFIRLLYICIHQILYHMVGYGTNICKCHQWPTAWKLQKWRHAFEILLGQVQAGTELVNLSL